MILGHDSSVAARFLPLLRIGEAQLKLLIGGTDDTNSNCEGTGIELEGTELLLQRIAR